jgi:hypothetical protein
MEEKEVLLDGAEEQDSGGFWQLLVGERQLKPCAL